MSASARRSSGIGRDAIYPLVIARSEATKQSILSFLGAMDCYAEPVIGRAFCSTRWLAMTLRGLTNPHRHFSKHAEIRLEHIAGVNRQRRMAGAGGHHLARLQRHAEFAQFIGEPCQCDPG